MQTQIAFRHMESSEAIKEYVHRKLQRLSRFNEFLFDASITLSMDHHRAVAEFVFAVKGDTLKCSEESEDMYASIDRGLDTAERMIRRYRDQKRERGKKPEPSEGLE